MMGLKSSIYFTLEGKILIAEDNETNQKLIVRFLEKKGIDYKVVHNGYEALEEYKQNHILYEVVFMDINMPEMDGITASKKILEYEKDCDLEHVPIITLTGNTQKEDKRSILAIGIDDYISKPIDLEEFYLKIAKFTYFIIENQIENEIILSEKNVPYNFDNVVVELELTEVFLKELLDVFFVGVEEELLELQKAVLVQDFYKITEISHSIKGSAGNLRLNSIFEKVKEIEQYSQSKDIRVNYGLLVDELKYLIKKYEKALK